MIRKYKEDIIKILVSVVLLIFGLLLDKFTDINEWILRGIFLVAYIVVSFEAYKEILENIREGFDIFDEDFLMAIASLGAFILGEYEESVMVFILFSIGEIFESEANERTKDSIESLMEIRPDYANILSDGLIKRVSPENIKVGDIIYVYPSEQIPLDGKLIEVMGGVSGLLNTSAITGESALRSISVGSEVLSGMVNASLDNRAILEKKEDMNKGIMIDGMLKIEVNSTFSESTVSKIIDLVKNAKENKSKEETFISKFAKVYTPIVFIIALCIMVIPSLITGAWNVWVYRGLTALVISCPCALVISVPLTFISGIGACSKNGILVKGSAFLEALSKNSIICFDKTGTLTKGDLKDEDMLKPTAKDAISSLKKLGVRYTIMLTGDLKEIADSVGKSLGIDKVYSELLPDEKFEKVKGILNDKEKNDVVSYVGDGINDAPSLRVADIGIAMGLNGQDIALEASDVVLMDDDPLKIAMAMRIGRRTVRIAKENVYFSLGIKLLCLILTFFGIVNMWLAVFSDVGVMMIATLNALRALKKDI